LERKDVKKQLIISIFTFFLLLFYTLLAYILGLRPPFRFILPFMGMTITFVSLIFYFINPEIMYGMWISRKKYKEIIRTNPNNRNIKIGRRITVGILLVVIIITFCVLIIHLI